MTYTKYIIKVMKIQKIKREKSFHQNQIILQEEKQTKKCNEPSSFNFYFIISAVMLIKIDTKRHEGEFINNDSEIDL